MPFFIWNVIKILVLSTLEKRKYCLRTGKVHKEIEIFWLHLLTFSYFCFFDFIWLFNYFARRYFTANRAQSGETEVDK